MQQMRWRFGCDPDSNTCCVPTDSSSTLATRLGIRGLVPLSEGSCTDLPGCLSQQYCWPAWALDSCRSFTTASACLAAKQCQVGRGSSVVGAGQQFSVAAAVPYPALVLCLPLAVVWKRGVGLLRGCLPHCQVPLCRYGQAWCGREGGWTTAAAPMRVCTWLPAGLDCAHVPSPPATPPLQARVGGPAAWLSRTTWACPSATTRV